MPSAQLDIAASDPRSRPSRSTEPGRRGRLGRWLGRLADIGVALVERMSAIAVYRRAYGGAASMRVDLNQAWDLVARAMRWTRALRARLADEAATAKAGMDPDEKMPERPERLDDGPDWIPRRARRTERPEPDGCIDGKPVAEVVGQICADLGAAATLLGDTKAARRIAAIAAAARALLETPLGTPSGGPAETWTPDRAAAEAEPAAMRAAATPAPDTG